MLDQDGRLDVIRRQTLQRLKRVVKTMLDVSLANYQTNYGDTVRMFRNSKKYNKDYVSILFE